MAYDLLVFYQVGLEYPAAQGGVDTQELNLLAALGSSSITMQSSPQAAS